MIIEYSFDVKYFLFIHKAQQDMAPPIERNINLIKFTGSYDDSGVINKVTVISVNGTMNLISQDFVMINYFNRF